MKPMKTRAAGLGRPEGPYELDDGRVIYASTYASEIGVWDPAANQQGQFAYVCGGPNACMLGTDNLICSTQSPNVGQRVAEVHKPPSIQRTTMDARVEILATDTNGIPLDGPNDLAFGPNGTLFLTGSGDFDIETMPHPGRVIKIDVSDKARLLEELGHVYPNGSVAEPDGSVVCVESYTCNVVRRSPDGASKAICVLPENHIPDSLKVGVEGSLWIMTVSSGGFDIRAKDGSHVDFLETAGTT